MNSHSGASAKKRLIEVSLPLDAINRASVREKSIRRGHPSTLHLWWARRPLAAARAIIFAQLVDDPSSRPDLFATEKAQDEERNRLFRLIEDLVQWENTTNEKILERAKAEIWRSWYADCAANVDHPRQGELFNPQQLPKLFDPFAGGGTLPLEAQRLGLDACASDLNPVAVLINKAMIEIPPRFAARAPINPASRRDKALFKKRWLGAEGLAQDVLFYGRWMRDEAEKRIGFLYPTIEITGQMAGQRPDLSGLIGKKLNVVAWIWARTVKSPNPAFAQVDVPLAATFTLSERPGHEAFVEPAVADGTYHFVVKAGKPPDRALTASGTKLGRGSNFRCLMSGAPIAGDYIKSEGKAGRMGARLMAVVVEGARGRLYLSPTADMEEVAKQANPKWVPDLPLPNDPRSFWTVQYGLTQYGDLFTARQIVALTTFSDLVKEARELVMADALSVGMPGGDRGLDSGVAARQRTLMPWPYI